MSTEPEQVDLSRLDPARLRRVAERLPSGLAGALRELADQAERGTVPAEELQALTGRLQGAVPQLQGLISGLPGSDTPAVPLPAGLREGLAELRSKVSPEVAAHLRVAEAQIAEVEAVASDLAGQVDAFKATLSQAVSSLAQGVPPPPAAAKPALIQGAPERLKAALIRLSAALGSAAEDAGAAEDPQLRAVAELNLSTLDALSVPTHSATYRRAVAICFQAAAQAGDVSRAGALGTALTSWAMAIQDWRGAAVIQHTLADCARDAGELGALLRARSKEALLLVREPTYADAAQLMMSEMRTLSAGGPLHLQALALLHSGDIAQQLGQAAQARGHWRALVELPGIGEEQPELAARAWASLGYLKLEGGSAKAAARCFDQALSLAEPLGLWSVLGPILRGQLTSLTQVGRRAVATQAFQHAKRLALAHGGSSGVTALAELGAELGLEA